MTGAEVDAIKEAADAKAWEELNEEDPRVTAAIDSLKDAIAALQQVEDSLNSAAGAVDDRPETYRIMSLMQSAVDLECDIEAQIRRF